MEDFHFSISAFQIKLRHFSSILRQLSLCYPTLSLGFTVFLKTVPIGNEKKANLKPNTLVKNLLLYRKIRLGFDSGLAPLLSG